MPGSMNGAQVAVKARHVNPGLKVLLTSGYTAEALTKEHGLPDDLEVLASHIVMRILPTNSDWSSRDQRRVSASANRIHQTLIGRSDQPPPHRGPAEVNLRILNRFG
jgi:hypothetical protein